MSQSSGGECDRAVGRYIRFLCDHPVADDELETAYDFLSDVFRAVQSDSVGVYFAIATRLRAADSEERLTAAGLLTVLVHDSTLVPLDESTDEAERIVLACLAGADLGAKMRICIMLAQHGTPVEMIPAVLRLVRHSDPCLSAAAGLALRRYDASVLDEALARRGLRAVGSRLVLEIEEVVFRGSGQGVPPIVRANCAASLLERSPIESAKYASAVGFLRDAPVRLRFPLLAAVHKSGRASKVAVEVLLALLHQSDQPRELRLMAAATVGRVAGRSVGVLRAVIDTYRGNNDDLVAGVLAGLAASGSIDEPVVQLLVPLFSSSSFAVRLQATSVLSRAAAVPEYALQAATAQAERDLENDEFAAALAALLAAAGEDAGPILIAYFNSGRPRHTSVVGMALQSVETKALSRLIYGLHQSYNSTLDGLLTATYKYKREDCAEVVPYVLTLLREAPGDLHRINYLQVIGYSRASTPDALAAVAQELDGRSQDVSDTAEAVLLSFGEAAVGPLELLVRQDTASRRPRAARALNTLTSPKPPRAERDADVTSQPKPDYEYVALCRSVGDFDLLWLFVLVVDTMKELGGAASLGDIAATLQELQKAGRVPGQLSCSKASISEKMKVLRERVNLDLFDYVTGRLGSPTPEGYKLRDAAKYFLQQQLRDQ